MIWSFPQLIGYCALVVGITAFLQKNDKTLIVLNAVECLILAAHFYLLDNSTAAVILTIIVFRNIASLIKRDMRIAFFFVALGIVAGLYTLKYWYSGLTIIAQMVTTTALFTCRGVALRLAYCFGSTCWIINNILTGSIGGVAIEVFVILANTITIIRLLRDQRARKIALELSQK